MRGKRCIPAHTYYSAGITPADAGKTLSVWQLNNQFQDHPRGCGENSSSMLSRMVRSGSPPRMRGKLMSAASIPRRIRITPADAGKTRNTCCGSAYCGDHPRGCGENIRHQAEAGGCQGSPPRMRGKPKKLGMKEVPCGITPADAGKTVDAKIALHNA